MDTLSGLEAASINSTQAPIISCFSVFGSEPAEAPAKRKQALDVSTSGGTGIPCRETYNPELLLWMPTEETVAPA